jgi:AraC family transcriptional regulator
VLLSLLAAKRARLKVLSNTESAGLLQISAYVDPDYTEATS